MATWLIMTAAATALLIDQWLNRETEEDVAYFYNLQKRSDVIRKMNEFWGFVAPYRGA